jgi:hypothetical protein
LSLLNLNLQGRESSVTPWRQRYSRIADWISQSQIVPDLLLFQEAPAQKCWNLGGCDPDSYEAMFLILNGIEGVTGVRYRIAAMSTGASIEGWNPLFQGQMIAYNPARLLNITPIPAGPGPWDSLSDFIIPRQSFPCRNNLPTVHCNRIDGDHWGARGVAFSRFAFIQLADSHVVDIYDVHAPFMDAAATPNLQIIADAVEAVEQQVPPQVARLFPPILAGDFNVDGNDMRQWELPPGRRLAKFQILASPDTGDVIGVLSGKADLFKSAYDVRASDNRFLPGGGEGLCGADADKWSDHCGQYVELSAYEVPR